MCFRVLQCKRERQIKLVVAKPEDLFCKLLLFRRIGKLRELLGGLEGSLIDKRTLSRSGLSLGRDDGGMPQLHDGIDRGSERDDQPGRRESLCCPHVPPSAEPPF